MLFHIAISIFLTLYNNRIKQHYFFFDIGFHDSRSDEVSTDPNLPDKLRRFLQPSVRLCVRVSSFPWTSIYPPTIPFFCFSCRPTLLDILFCFITALVTSKDRMTPSVLLFSLFAIPITMTSTDPTQFECIIYFFVSGILHLECYRFLATVSLIYTT